jgi:hypothetical protein
VFPQDLSKKDAKPMILFINAISNSYHHNCIMGSQTLITGMEFEPPQ